MNYLQAEKISKSYRDIPLFSSLSLSIEKNQKIALIAKNGTGKSTLLRILAGIEVPDQGMVNSYQGLQIGFLPQDPHLVDELEVLDQVLFSLPEVSGAIRDYEKALTAYDTEGLDQATAEMDRLSAWDAESRIKEVLSRLKITRFDQRVGELSGGQRKRVALASVLVSQPDLLLLDEPTNHLDLEMIEWLEEYLSQSFITLLMVTHDRYFLDRVCNEILEMDHNTIYRYKGNYHEYLDKRSERMELDQRQVEKANSILKKELEWVNRMPQARGTKAKYRVDAFYKLKEDSRREYQAEIGDIQVLASRLGKKVLDIYNLSKAYDELVLFNNFNYKFQRLERIGIIGANGIGKSTFLSVLTGLLQPDSGKVDVGTTVRFGFYQQQGIEFNPEDKVIDAVREIAEVVDLGPGRSMNVQQFLEYFLFPREVQYGYISKLSGGEKRRLYMMTVLMQNPNFLILDEPTNDLDIFTLNVLEDYLLHFRGTVIIVSHDRYFMDKVVDHLFVFEGEGIIHDFPGNYTIYRDSLLAEKEKKTQAIPPKEKRIKTSGIGEKKKLTFNEKREFEALSDEISQLENEKSELEKVIGSGSCKPDDLIAYSSRIGEIIRLVDEKEMRWLYLSEYDS